MRTRVNHDELIRSDLRSGNYRTAALKIENLRKENKYTKKDRVLYYLDKGTVLHYQGEYRESNRLLEEADRAMEDLFTRSISQIALSMLLNDNALDYYGEVYESLYVNIFKALNYVHLNNLEGAYVEVRRMNDKLRLLDDKYGSLVDRLNSVDTTGIKIEKQPVQFYNDALAHYLTYLIFRAEGEQDNSRISFERCREAWAEHRDVYDYPIPNLLTDEPHYEGTFLNVLAFAGSAPQKKAIGGKITTYDSLIHISDLSGYKENLVLPFPGVKQGYHFKFAFPDVQIPDSRVRSVAVTVDSRPAGRLELFEAMGKVAVKTFAAQKNIIYFKTLIRTVLKGLASEKAKADLRKKADAEDNFLLGALINFGVDAAVDATENADLRCWKTMPQNCFAGEFPVSPGMHSVEILFYDAQNSLLHSAVYPEFRVTGGLNLLEAACLN